jgi:hypothetical protein
MQQRCEVDLLLIVLSAIACPVLFTISDKYLILPAIVPYMRYADSCVREREGRITSVYANAVLRVSAS